MFAALALLDCHLRSTAEVPAAIPVLPRAADRLLQIVQNE
jgi:hypothetical protein